MVGKMSANELLEQVKALPPRERRKFLDGIQVLEWEICAQTAPQRQRAVRWPDAAERRRRIFGDKVMPNLVLAAREEERY